MKTFQTVMGVGRKFSTIATSPSFINTRKPTKKKKLFPEMSSKRNKEEKGNLSVRPQHRGYCHRASRKANVQVAHMVTAKIHLFTYNFCQFFSINAKVLLVIITVTLPDWLPIDYIQRFRSFIQPTQLCFINDCTGTERVHLKHEPWKMSEYNNSLCWPKSALKTGTFIFEVFKEPSGK